MKILFVSSGNSGIGISPIVKNQGESLQRLGVNISYYAIKGRGLKGYLNNIVPLKEFINKYDFDIIHAHYSLSAIVASLAGAKKIVVSLMGSDVKSRKLNKLLIKLFNMVYWSKIIVKSDDMKLSLGINDCSIIPNGVDFNRFRPLDQTDCKKKLKWDLSKKQILFAANPDRREKNFQLAILAVNHLHDSNCELKVLNKVPNEQVPLYHNAANLILLTSLWEGSPNVIKEAMACNIPVVSTNVGDVSNVIGNTEGCYITNFDHENVTGNLRKALDFGKRTTGRDEIQRLDDRIISQHIMQIYDNI
jgi:teichuronic acid biosynthesis glycosyltransferase TuaC